MPESARTDLDESDVPRAPITVALHRAGEACKLWVVNTLRQPIRAWIEPWGDQIFLLPQRSYVFIAQGSDGNCESLISAEIESDGSVSIWKGSGSPRLRVVRERQILWEDGTASDDVLAALTTPEALDKLASLSQSDPGQEKHELARAWSTGIGQGLEPLWIELGFVSLEPSGAAQLTNRGRELLARSARDAEYRSMSEDHEHEAEALDWIEAMIGDAADELQ